jgi:hypothetical protein
MPPLPSALRTLTRHLKRGLAASRGQTSNLDEETIVARLVNGANLDRSFVDIAAGDGLYMSNTYALAKSGWRGLSVEMDGARFKALARRHAALPDSHLVRGRVTVDNVLAVLAAAEVPAAFGFLSLDIDGYDHFILERLLSAHRPGLICAEINERIPPPVCFTVLYDPSYIWDGSAFFGQSLAQVELLCAAHRYAIVQLEYNNVFLMPSEIAPLSISAAEAYRSGYVDRPDRRERFPWNNEFESLLSMSPDEVVEHLTREFATHTGRFSISATG